MRSLLLLLLFSCAIPPRDAEQFRARGLFAKYFISAVILPCSIRGDYDGDGRGDVAFSIENQSTGERGIAICRSSRKTCDVLGAGTPFDRQTDLSWMDQWSKFARGPVGRGAGEGPPPRLRGDAILAEKSESASGLIYWNGRRFAWYQQGD
jgi:hypothetical protein